jgi:very-short-patch-repair endonuclease
MAVFGMVAAAISPANSSCPTICARRLKSIKSSKKLPTLTSLLDFMRTKWRKRISAFLLPKSEKIPWRRERIRGKAPFRPHDNAFKKYKLFGPPELMKQHAMENRAKQLDERGYLKWPAEIACDAILRRIGVYRQYQYVIYYPGGFLICDFWLPGHALRIEVDGKEHLENYVFDKTRDDWLLKNMRIRTLRLKNDMVKRNQLAAEAIIREAIGQ